MLLGILSVVGQMGRSEVMLTGAEPCHLELRLIPHSTQSPHFDKAVKAELLHNTVSTLHVTSHH